MPFFLGQKFFGVNFDDCVFLGISYAELRYDVPASTSSTSHPNSANNCMYLSQPDTDSTMVDESQPEENSIPKGGNKINCWKHYFCIYIFR